MEAEARGDAETALDAWRRGLRIEDSPHEADLLHLMRLGADAPAWTVARWLVNQAYRWMLLNEDPRLDTAVRLTLATTYDLPRDVTPEWLYEVGTQTAACDWICEEIAVYHFGGLADFLDVKATPELLSRAGQPSRPLA